MQNTPSKQQTKQKYKPNHQQTGSPPHSALPIRGKTSKQTKRKHSAVSHPIGSSHRPLDQPWEGRNQKEERIQHWSLGKRDFKHSKLKENNEKSGKYYTDEGTNQKHRSPNTWRGNRQTTWYTNTLTLNTLILRKGPHVYTEPLCCTLETKTTLQRWSKPLKTKYRKWKNQLTKTLEN